VALPSFVDELTNQLVARTPYDVQRPAYEPDEKLVETIRKLTGGNITPLPQTRLRWYPADVETAMIAADGGDLMQAAQLWRASATDGAVKGVLDTRTKGLVRLPLKFFGPSDQVDALSTGQDRARSVFWEMFPPGELVRFASDFVGLGVAVGELLPVNGRAYPVFCRLAPEFLHYRQNENRWYYRSRAGLLPINPGDGRWVLCLAGRVAPWQDGVWPAVGSAWIDKLHAKNGRANWQATLANPARVAESPIGATEYQRDGWFQAVAAWGYNTVFEMPPGYKVNLLESNGRGYESFNDTVKDSEREAIIAITGQVVTVDGGSGFQNNDIFETIRGDVIATDGDTIAHALSTQAIPQGLYGLFGPAAMQDSAGFRWDTTPPEVRKARALAMTQVAASIQALDAALAVHGQEADVSRYADEYGLYVREKNDNAHTTTDGTAGDPAAGNRPVSGTEPGNPEQ